MDKYGIVVLVDALGTRMATIPDSYKYIETVGHLRRTVRQQYGQLSGGSTGRRQTAAKEFPDLRYRYFGDTLLLTLEVSDESKLAAAVEMVSWILNGLIPTAIGLGVLFRGALSIGEYIERDNVCLGPAITDAAQWHEQLELIAVMATPSTTNRLKCLWAQEAGDQFDESSPDAIFDAMFLYPVPVKSGAVETYILNWPSHIVTMQSGQVGDPQRWYYQYIAPHAIPLGTERKYANTEAFVKKSLDRQRSRTGGR